MVALSDWLPNDWQLAATIVCLILIVLALILSALRRIFVTRAEFARLQGKFEKQSDGVNGLLRAEERRFINELKASKNDDEPPNTASAFVMVAQEY
jgi:hypothetical protein